MSALFTTAAYAFCCLAFGTLVVSLRPGLLDTGLPRLRLRVAALVTIAWAVAGWAMRHGGGVDVLLSRLLSFVLAGVWVWQLVPYARAQGQPRALVRLLGAAGVLVVVPILVWMLLAIRIPTLSPPSLAMLSLPGLLLCSLGLVAVEQIYRNASRELQPGLRWLELGMAGLLLAELVAWAQILLVGRITVAQGPLRAAAYGLCALAMLRGARMLPQWASGGLAVSRQVVFYTSSVLLVGIYLILMAAAGWILLRHLDGWPAIAQFSFSLLAALGLVLSLFSGGLLQRLKVFISRHFYSQRYDYRSEWMRFTHMLSDPASPGEVPQKAIHALARIVGSPGGTLWRHEAEDGLFTRQAEWPAAAPAATPPVPEDGALPAYLRRTAWLVDLAELARRPALYEGLELDPALLDAAADALIVPLLHVDRLYGWIVLSRAPGQGELDFEDRDLLKVAGRHLAAHLAQLDADARLAQAQQFETYNRMTAFVMHDLKNIAAQLGLVSQNAGRHRHNPEFIDDALRTVTAAATRMTRLISQLASGRGDGTLQTLALAGCAERAVQRCAGHVPVPQVVVRQRPGVFADREHLTSAIEHAIRNAQDATPADGEVRVEVDCIDGRPGLHVIDTGCGMDGQFLRERLFRPFDTTKGSRGMGVGAYQIREYMRSLGGEVRVQSEPLRGTRFTLLFADMSSLGKP